MVEYEYESTDNVSTTPTTFPIPLTLSSPYSVTALQFSPFFFDTIAIGTGQNFGIAGGGTIEIFKIVNTETNNWSRSHIQHCSQAVLDITWSERVENILSAGLGDGSIHIVNVANKNSEAILRGHIKECCSLDWNIHNTNYLLSSSWDSSIIVWDIAANTKVSQSFNIINNCVYQASWSPLHPLIIGASGSGGIVKIIDFRDSSTTINVNCIKSLPQPHSYGVIASNLCHYGDVLSFDWNKYSPFIISTSGTDNIVRIWDLRKFQITQRIDDGNLLTCHGHELAVRSVRWSPFHHSILASGSYDMTVCIWDALNSSPLQYQYSAHHSEFIIGVDWNLFFPGVIASGSWDRTVGIWNAFSNKSPEQKNTVAF